jgi:DNA-binding LacI/PurR family transcriptional regulator
VVAVPAQRSWHYLFAHKPLNDFALPFHAEMLEHKLNISVAFLQKETSPKSPLTMASGENEIIRYIESIKSRFRGMLIACDPGETNGLDTLIPKACRFKKPVVLFDVADTGKFLANAIGTAAKHYYRAHFHETGATGIAARALTGMGHKRIAIPFIEDRPHPWMQRRIRRITDCIHACDPSAEVTAGKLTHSFWSTTDWRDIHHFVSMLQEYEAHVRKKRAKQVIRKGSILKRARKYGHELISLLDKTRATAIVAPNDTIARELYFFCNYVGINIPLDISLLSFDNNPIASLFPLCTIDPGLAQLGYLCAHIIIGDFKVKTRPDRSIPSKCRLINRGSLAEA